MYRPGSRKQQPGVFLVWVAWFLLTELPLSIATRHPHPAPRRHTTSFVWKHSHVQGFSCYLLHQAPRSPPNHYSALPIYSYLYKQVLIQRRRQLPREVEAGAQSTKLPLASLDQCLGLEPTAEIVEIHR